MVSAQRIDQPLPPVAKAAPDVVVAPVRSLRDRDAFVDFQYEVYRDNPVWIPPLVMERKEFLNPHKNPVLEHTVMELFLARRGGRVVGRVAALEDALYLQTHGTRTGYFGLFECIDDPGVAASLFDAVRAWGRGRGLASVIGPLSLNINGEPGILVEGFDMPPTILTPYNPPYYGALLEACGMAKIKDLWGWYVDNSHPIPEKPARIAEKVREKEGVVVRPVRLNDFEGEIRILKDVYNAAWEKNWGFVPITDREIEQMARDLRPIIVPELSMVAEVNGEAIAMSITVPDANQAIKLANGRLTTYGLPIGLARMLGGLKKIKRLRFIALGIKAGYRRRGIDAVITFDTMRKALELGFQFCEISWTLEDNHLVNRAIEVFGGKKYKTWRLYESPV